LGRSDRGRCEPAQQAQGKNSREPSWRCDITQEEKQEHAIKAGMGGSNDDEPKVTGQLAQQMQCAGKSPNRRIGRTSCQPARIYTTWISSRLKLASPRKCRFGGWFIWFIGSVA